MHTVDAEHRRHAEVELAIRDSRTRRSPTSRRAFKCDAAWTVTAGLAHNMVRWIGNSGSRTPPGAPRRTIRRWRPALPGRLTRTALALDSSPADPLALARGLHGGAEQGKIRALPVGRPDLSSTHSPSPPCSIGRLGLLALGHQLR